jgi:hypothetical protein
LSRFKEIWLRAPAVSDRTDTAGEPVVSAAFFRKCREKPLFFLFEQSKRTSKKEPGLAKRFLRAHTSAPKGPARPEGGYLAAQDRLAKGFFRLVFLPPGHAHAD